MLLCSSKNPYLSSRPNTKYSKKNISYTLSKINFQGPFTKKEHFTSFGIQTLFLHFDFTLNTRNGPAEAMLPKMKRKRF